MTIRTSHLRGAVRLAADATIGLTELVEAMHERVARLPGVSSSKPGGRTDGITGLVYKSIRTATQLVGGSVDALLGFITQALESDHDLASDREVIVAVLNGVLGDHLAATGNPLATPMTMRSKGRALNVEGAGPGDYLPDASAHVLLIHGLCMNDLHWSRQGHDHGQALFRDLGFTPIYLRYNSGLHVSSNGRALAEQLENLVEQWPKSIARLVVVGHSMGGLLARSALHYGAEAGHRWPSRLTDLVFLGTPHHGAPLERAGNWVNALLDATPYAAPFSRLGKIRSAGITDLRHGNLLDGDWTGRDRFAHHSDERQHVPLPGGVRCYALAGSIGLQSSGLKQRILGDGLVPLDSALGRHRDSARCLVFRSDRQWTGFGLNHLDLLNDQKVYAQLLRWLTP
jgi:pimeloyl-ACP methyl ester carboxylesterase